MYSQNMFLETKKVRYSLFPFFLVFFGPVLLILCLCSLRVCSLLHFHFFVLDLSIVCALAPHPLVVTNNNPPAIFAFPALPLAQRPLPPQSLHLLLTHRCSQTLQCCPNADARNCSRYRILLTSSAAGARRCRHVGIKS